MSLPGLVGLVAVAGDRGHRDLGQLSQALNTEQAPQALAPLVDELFAVGNAGLDRFLFRIGEEVGRWRYFPRRYTGRGHLPDVELVVPAAANALGLPCPRDPKARSAPPAEQRTRSRGGSTRKAASYRGTFVANRGRRNGVLCGCWPRGDSGVAGVLATQVSEFLERQRKVAQL